MVRTAQQENAGLCLARAVHEDLATLCTESAVEVRERSIGLLYRKPGLASWQTRDDHGKGVMELPGGKQWLCEGDQRRDLPNSKFGKEILFATFLAVRRGSACILTKGAKSHVRRYAKQFPAPYEEQSVGTARHNHEHDHR